jgi:hypothetical protein
MDMVGAYIGIHHGKTDLASDGVELISLSDFNGLGGHRTPDDDGGES